MHTPDLSRYTGCLIGGAVGDALGAPTEFMSLSSILQQYGPGGVSEYVEYPDGKGHVTDDTQMLLFTAEGLLRAFHRTHLKGISGAYLQICHESYLRWLHTQMVPSPGQALKDVPADGWLLGEQWLYSRRAPGNTCLTALRSGVQGTMEKPINNSKGCGGIMRIAPVSLLFFRDPEQAFRIGAELAALTHGHPSGYLSAGALAAILAFLCHGADLLTAIHETERILAIYPHAEETQRAIVQALDLYKEGNPTFAGIERLGGAWVGEEALAISLYCSLCGEGDFEKSITLAVNHSGDTDSTGAIAGNIMGLMLGEQAIPRRWMANLANHEPIARVAADLHEQAMGTAYRQPGWGERYPPY